MGNLFCGFQCAATGEDGQRAEDSLLLCGQQVIAPGDGRAQSLLAGVGVSAASQQVEAVGEAVKDLCWRERLRAGGGELDRERKVVEPGAELGDLV